MGVDSMVLAEVEGPARRTCVEIKFYGAFVLKHRVVLHAIGATPRAR